MSVLFGVVSEVISSPEGWYRVQPSCGENTVRGVSIKRTPLTMGQRVRIVQSGHWTTGKSGWAFAEESSGINTVFELFESRNKIASQNPAGASLAYLLHKAGNAREYYHPGIVTAVNATSLALKDWHTDNPMGSWAVSSDLSPSDFSVGDGVLCRCVPDQLMGVVGWWETVNSTLAGAVFTKGPIVGGLTILRSPVFYNFLTNSTRFLNESDWVSDQTVFDKSSLWAQRIFANGDTDPAGEVSFTNLLLPNSQTYATVYLYTSKNGTPAPVVFSYAKLPSEFFDLVETIYRYKEMPNQFCTLFPRGTKKMRFWDELRSPGNIRSTRIVQESPS